VENVMVAAIAEVMEDGGIECDGDETSQAIVRL
jgi:hypothetical protein